MSFLNASLALPLATASMALHSISNDGSSGEQFSNRLNGISDRFRGNMSSGLQRTFDIGDAAQKGVIDVVDSLLRLDIASVARPGADVIHPAMVTARAISGESDWYTNWQELRNKLEVFDLVQNVDKRIGASADIPISNLVDRAYALGDFPALWAVEGLGHYYAKRALNLDTNPRGLLSNPDSIWLPRKSLAMMNAGMGLAFAERMFDQLAGSSNETRVDQKLAAFFQLCKENATTGYTGCALESLGLVARTFNKKYVNVLDNAILRTGDQELLGYFWHGAGRANYFALENFIPCTGISWKKLVQQSSHKIGISNLVAGLAWAVTMVNKRHASVLQKLLKERLPEIRQESGDAFVDGMSSALTIRQDTTPLSHLVDAFCFSLGSCSFTKELAYSVCQSTKDPIGDVQPESLFRFALAPSPSRSFSDHRVSL